MRDKRAHGGLDGGNRPMKIFFLALLLLVSCSKENPPENTTTFFGSNPPSSSSPKSGAGWTSAQIDEKVEACVTSALGGQTNNPSLEEDAKKHCRCAIEVAANEYSFTYYDRYGTYANQDLERDGKLKKCE